MLLELSSFPAADAQVFLFDLSAAMQLGSFPAVQLDCALVIGYALMFVTAAYLLCLFKTLESMAIFRRELCSTSYV